MADPTLAEVAARLKTAKRAAVFTHHRPDPDALGSQSAAALLLKAAGVTEVTAVLFEPPPGPYKFLVDGLPGVNVVTFSPEWAAGAGATCDTVLVVDTCTYQQMEPARAFLEASRQKVVAIDHHASRDAIGSLLHTDTSTSAAAELVFELGEKLGVAIDERIATRIMSGIVGDTGWFRFDSVTPRTHRIAAKLIEAGAEPAKMYEQLMQRETPPKLGLMQRALASLAWAGNQRVAVMTLTLRDFADVGAVMSQTEYIVDLPMQVGRVEVAGLLTELPENKFRLSLRSKRDVDVNKVCRNFGGGGHVKAAGARLDGPLEAARQRVIDAVVAELK